MRLQAGYASNVGLVRQTNEDSYLLRRGLYAVCDGMGGARAGEIASEMACRGLLDIDPLTADGPALMETVMEINRSISERSGQDASLLGMGTTLTAALAGPDKLTLVHVGDSRAYLLHDGGLRQLTEDHSWVAEMIRRGELTPAEAAIHPHRSVITKALGTERELEPDLLEVEVEPRDRLLLCSDGLTGMVSDRDIEEALSQALEAQEAADFLAAAALAAGGEDNVTVIVVDIHPETGAAPEPKPGAEGASDEIILGPLDRAVAGASAAATRPHRGVRAAARGRLGGRLGGRPPHPDGADPVPATGPLPVPGSLPAAAAPTEPQVQSQAQPRKSSKRRWFVVTIIVLAVLIVAVAGFAVFNSAVYYVGTYEGSVALFNGLPGSIFGIGLSSVIEQATVAYDSLPSYVQARIDTHELTTKEEGQKYLRSLSAVQ
jgi:serine/threonine protein phosphatase PrpC